MTNEEVLSALANLPDPGNDIWDTLPSWVEGVRDLSKAAQDLQPQPEIKLRHIYLDNDWPDYVAVIPLRLKGDVVECFVGMPGEAERLTLQELEVCPYTTKTVRFITTNCTLRLGLDTIPF